MNIRPNMNADDSDRQTWLFKLLMLLTGILAGFIIARIFITPIRVSDNSMLPNFKKDELVFVVKVGKIKFGDVVLFKSPVEKNHYSVKRVVAVSGDSMAVENKQLMKNGSLFLPPWTTISGDSRIFSADFSRRDNLAKKEISPKAYFLIGDNLDDSFDSREFGEISKKNIVGKVIYKIK